MTAPGFGEFFQNFQRLASIQAQREAQKLAENQAGASMMSTFTTVAAQIAPEARESFVQNFARSTGLDENLLRQTATNLPQSVATTQARKVEAGAGAISDPAVAAAALTGQSLGGLAQSGLLAQGIGQGISPEMMQQFMSRQLTGAGAGANAVDTAIVPIAPQAAAIATGVEMSAPQRAGIATQQRGQNMNYQLGTEQLHQQERFEAGRQAMNAAELNARMAAIRQETAGGALSRDQYLELANMNRQMNDALAKGGTDRTVELQYVVGLMNNYQMMGYTEAQAKELSGYDVMMEGKAIDPGWYRRFLNKNPGVNP